MNHTLDWWGDMFMKINIPGLSMAPILKNMVHNTPQGRSDALLGT